MSSTRASIWFDGPGDWAWPGARGVRGGGAGEGAATAAIDLAPPPWVPALPGGSRTGVGGAHGLPARRAHGGLRSGATLLLLALVALCVGLAIDGRADLERLAGLRATPPSAATLALERSVDATPAPLPAVVRVSTDSTGSSIDSVGYRSQALDGHEGSFLVYLPAGYARTAARYPVIYLLHGDDQTDSSFLTIGLWGTLDRLIAHHTIPPVIAVMIQGGPGSNNWLNTGSQHYESYVLEVQRLVDRLLPTIPTRDARAIAGYSMGGYGAMHIALTHPTDFGTAESWLGFFNGLSATLPADRSVISRLGLRAYVYGGAEDHIANPSEDLPFAAALRADGADAHGAVFPGEHSFATLEAHLEQMLAFAGRDLAGHAP
jgi:enterochelin esterase-like enzyme